jgi:hypothetical protein
MSLKLACPAPFVSTLRNGLALAALVMATAGAMSISGCRDTAESAFDPPPAVENTGGSGGKGSGGSKGTGGAKATGGSMSAPATGGVTGTAGDSGAVDSPADVPATTQPEVGTTVDMSVADTVSGPDTAPGKVAVCWPDSKVIKICHQLENACENCPPGGAPPKNTTATTCFALVKKAYAGMATDEDCAKFAVEHKCTVDNVATTGNVCGSLNCYAPGCKDKERCLNRQQWGDSSMCTQFMATCPCK